MIKLKPGPERTEWWFRHCGKEMNGDIRNILTTITKLSFVFVFFRQFSDDAFLLEAISHVVDDTFEEYAVSGRCFQLNDLSEMLQKFACCSSFGSS